MFSWKTFTFMIQMQWFEGQSEYLTEVITNLQPPPNPLNAFEWVVKHALVHNIKVI